MYKYEVRQALAKQGTHTTLPLALQELHSSITLQHMFDHCPYSVDATDLADICSDQPYKY